MTGSSSFLFGGWKALKGNGGGLVTGLADEAPIEVEPAEVAQWLQSGTDVLLLDCREPVEHQTVSIEQAILLPMSELPRRVAELAVYRQRRIVVHCHHGVRSLQVAAWLRQQGYSAQSMVGGIDRWSCEIDPSKPRY